MQDKLSHPLVGLASVLVEFVEACHSWKVHVVASLGVQMHVLDFAGSLMTCKLYRRNNTYSRLWIESLLSCFIMQFGGTIMTAMLLGQPPGCMLHHASTVSLLVAWWLTFCSPFDIFWKSISTLPSVVFTAMGACTAISSGHAVTTWGADKAIYNNFHTNDALIRHSVVVSVSCGVISSVGGGLLADFLNLRSAHAFTSNKSLDVLSNTEQGHIHRAKICRCFVLSCVYVLLMRNAVVADAFWSKITQDETRRVIIGHFIICSLQLLNWASSLFFPSIDMCCMVFDAFKEVLCIQQYIPCDHQPSELTTKTKKKNSQKGMDEKPLKVSVIHEPIHNTSDGFLRRGSRRK